MTPTYSVLEQIEQAIVCQLKPVERCGFEIQSLPQVQAEMEKPATKPRVTISYRESERSEPKAMGVMRQERTFTFQVTFQARVLRGKEGIYKLMAAVESLLMGFMPPHCDRIQLRNDRFDMFENNTWRWILDISLRAMHMQEFSDEEVGPLLREVTFVEP